MWDRYYSKLKRLPKRLEKLARFVIEAVPVFKSCKVEKVLDLGCGVGRHCIYLAKNGFDVIGVDVSKHALIMAKEWVRKEMVVNTSFIQASMTNLPFADCYFDAVVSVSVIHHAIKRDIVNAVGEVYRVLKEKGLFLANLTSNKDPRYGTGQKIEDNTFRILEAFEEKRFEELHHFFTEQEISNLLFCFAEAKVELLKDKPYYWRIMATRASC